MKENAQTSKRYQRGFKPGLSRLRVRHSTTEPPRSIGSLLLLFRKALPMIIIIIICVAVCTGVLLATRMLEVRRLLLELLSTHVPCLGPLIALEDLRKHTCYKNNCRRMHVRARAIAPMATS